MLKPRTAVQETQPQDKPIQKDQERTGQQDAEPLLLPSPRPGFPRDQTIHPPIRTQRRLPVGVTGVPFEPGRDGLVVRVIKAVPQSSDGTVDQRLIMPLHLPHGGNVQIGYRWEMRPPSVEQSQLPVARAKAQAPPQKHRTTFDEVPGMARSRDHQRRNLLHQRAAETLVRIDEQHPVLA